MTEPSTPWKPVSIETMRHIVNQMRLPKQLSDARLGQLAQGFLAPNGGPVEYSAQRRTVGGTTITLLTMSAMRINGQDASTSDTIYISFALGGKLTVIPRDGESTDILPGSASAITDWRSFTTECSDGTRLLQLEMPEERLHERGIRVHTAHYRLESSRSLQGPLRSFALAIADSSWNSSPVGELVVERALEDLVVGMFLEADGFSMDSDDLRAALRIRALAVIASRHRQPELTPRLVAEYLAVSLRHLQRAFEDSGMSASGAIARRRAETAALLLSAPGAASLTIDEIAKRAGLSSTYQLRTAFRSHFGMLPSQYRDEHGVTSSHAPRQG